MPSRAHLHQRALGICSTSLLVYKLGRGSLSGHLAPLISNFCLRRTFEDKAEKVSLDAFLAHEEITPMRSGERLRPMPTTGENAEETMRSERETLGAVLGP
jgi:hypothetical protein